ncbi:hypothetical protein F3Y22_tig00110013pilonHSYRG00244 [Hibiscus syriacus]|uniref:R13L1/DRL21-like LRR repeat region domain-containing protein n=1 Tax=Hibiscus syriacus TaxID=106335 RepID=A0A6A3BRC4_HIBSY|nr:hypothetical protein F3Y22_tig00110013pilonHSYRG00244 [Hibiscus syriacus]
MGKPSSRPDSTSKSDKKFDRSPVLRKLKEGKQLTAVLEHPAFQVNPLAAIHQHLQNTQPVLDEKPKKKLGCINELHGELRICNLQLVRHKQEANGANLHRKEKLYKVILEWSWTARDYNSEQVMEGLQPHSNLQSLIVVDFPGKNFPSWMSRPIHGSNTGLFLLNNLQLELINCKCTSLPLGQLQNLQFLKLKNLVKMESIEFHYGQCSGGNTGDQGVSCIAKIHLRGDANLKEWTKMAAANTIMFPCKIGDGPSTSTCLKELLLYQCPDLSSIPNLEGFSSLRNLTVDCCNTLEVLPIEGRCSSLEKHWIIECVALSKIGAGLSTASCLEELEINSCPYLTSIPYMEGFSYLERLNIASRSKLERFPLRGPLPCLIELRIWRRIKTPAAKLIAIQNLPLQSNDIRFTSTDIGSIRWILRRDARNPGSEFHPTSQSLPSSFASDRMEKAEVSPLPTSTPHRPRWMTIG